MMMIENTFEIGDTVYLRTDSTQSRQIVTRLQISSNGIMYCTSSGFNADGWHYDYELSRDPYSNQTSVPEGSECQ